MNFLRNLLASIIGFFIAMALIFGFFLLIASVMGKSDKVIVKPNSVLEIDLSKKIKDYAPKDKNPLAEILEIENPNIELSSIINAIENAKTDPQIKGISIKNTIINAGYSQTESIRRKLEEFKESGKFVYAYADFYLQKNYYLSSVADSIFLNPAGLVELKGLSSEILYFKDFQKKYGVKMEVIRHGKYKSAVEPFLSDKMSEENRQQNKSLLNSIWGNIAKGISKSRKISTEKLNILTDNVAGKNAETAAQNNLIDGSIYQNKYEEKLKIATKEKPEIISLINYIKSGKGRTSSTSKNKIAVVYAQGDIKYAKGNENVIGQEMMTKAIRKVKKDKTIKAIVFRVNSGGGSALASEIILKELELAKKEKPVVVSMGDYAASGGYYIACKANKIFAEPATITGSIGVFGLMPNLYEMTKKMGINAEKVATNKNPDYSFFKPMSEDFRKITKEGVEFVYKTFINNVAQGRKMTFEQVNEVAQGRVWSGIEAKEKGLVDELGGLQDAIKEAAKLAEIDDFKIRTYPAYKKSFKDVFSMSLFTKISKQKAIQEALGDEAFKMYNNINQMKNLKGIQARMPFVIEIK